MSRSMIRGLALVFLGTLLGLGAGRVMPNSEAAPGIAPVKLGHPTAFVLSQAGHPLKIAYGPEHQIWYYADPAGQVRARYWLDEGVVVRVEGD